MNLPGPRPVYPSVARNSNNPSIGSANGRRINYGGDAGQTLSSPQTCGSAAATGVLPRSTVKLGTPCGCRALTLAKQGLC
jgi:hypothetical protein